MHRMIECPETGVRKEINMKVLNSIMKHIENSYEANRAYVLESYTKPEQDHRPAWQTYIDSARKANRI